MTTENIPRPSDALPAGARDRRGPLRYGDKVQLTDAKGRLHTIVLESGKVFHTHRGGLAHDDIVGQSEGVVVHNTTGQPYQVLRPLLSDYVLSMPRGAAVVYPKDAAMIVSQADVFPGARVVEAGVGSGALTLSLLRAVGDSGRVHSFERREDFAEVAAGNIRDFFSGPHPAWQLTLGDLREALPREVEAGSVDRVVLDMLAPWECLDAVAYALAPGGVFVVYVATATQLSRTAEALEADGRFTQVLANETLVRDWHLEGLAVRPEHRMIAHTGFLLSCRRLADGSERLRRKKRPQGSEPTEEDKAAWTGKEFTDEAVGASEVTPKKLRRAQREAGRRADLAEEGLQEAPEDTQEDNT